MSNRVKTPEWTTLDWEIHLQKKKFQMLTIPNSSQMSTIHIKFIVILLFSLLILHIFMTANPWTEQSSPGHLIFFLLPIGIQISINFILFILTAIHCNRIKAEIHRMQSCDNSDQQKKKIFVADKAMWVNFLFLFFYVQFLCLKFYFMEQKLYYSIICILHDDSILKWCLLLILLCSEQFHFSLESFLMLR